MPDSIPKGITREFVLQAIEDFDAGRPHAFGESTGYDLVFEHRRYPPKAILGLAAAYLLGEPLGPYDFKGGLESKCFRVLTDLGFQIVAKSDENVFPDELPPRHFEGAREQVVVNRFERDSRAREACIRHYGARCRVCEMNMADRYGVLGEGFIHVHHVIPLSDIDRRYEVDPIEDLRPVCPNCHAMLHRRVPPLSIEELRELL